MGFITAHTFCIGLVEVMLYADMLIHSSVSSTKTDLIRGVIVAAKEDVLENSSATARRRAVEVIAAGA